MSAGGICSHKPYRVGWCWAGRWKAAQGRDAVVAEKGKNTMAREGQGYAQDEIFN
jgi:hypothetical protein